MRVALKCAAVHERCVMTHLYALQILVDIFVFRHKAVFFGRLGKAALRIGARMMP